MWTHFFHSLSLIDISGYLIIAAILLILCTSLILNMVVRSRYQKLKIDVRAHQRDGVPARHQMLRSLILASEDANWVTDSEADVQTLIEFHFSRYFSWALTAERFLKSAAGMMIVLGLVGTFYGLTLSIGKLVALITEDPSGIAEMTSSLTRGLAGALSGMSVAFSTSLVGILSAIVIMVVGVFRSPADMRNALCLELEVFLSQQRQTHSSQAKRDEPTGQLMNEVAEKLQQAMASFGDSLQLFSGNIRDFKEFNAHLKDNIQRMSLEFSDLSQTLKAHTHANKPDVQGRER